MSLDPGRGLKGVFWVRLSCRWLCTAPCSPWPSPAAVGPEQEDGLPPRAMGATEGVSRELAQSGQELGHSWGGCSQEGMNGVWKASLVLG